MNSVRYFGRDENCYAKKHLIASFIEGPVLVFGDKEFIIPPT